MPTCDRCGNELEDTNPGGRYRDKCLECIEAIAAEIPSHRNQCDGDDCLICAAP